MDMGPCRTAVGSLLLISSFETMTGSIRVCIAFSSSLSIAIAGREYLIEGSYVVRTKTRMSFALRQGDRIFAANASAFLFKDRNMVTEITHWSLVNAKDP